MKPSCRRTNLASRGSFQVERCSCGAINVHVGAMTIRLAPSAMEQLATTLAEAAVNNRQLERMADESVPDMAPTPSTPTDSAEVEMDRGRPPRATDKTFH